MKRKIHRLFIELTFPGGISAGEGRNGNHGTFARDGQGRPVLRGSALAGALRHAWSEAFDPSDVSWFGDAATDADHPDASRLEIPDCVLDIGGQNAGALPYRTHIAVDRHSGAVLDNALMTLECLPPGTSASACLWLTTEGEEDGTTFLRQIVSVLGAGFSLGGHAARGIGGVDLVAAKHRVFDLSSLEDHANWLQEKYDVLSGKRPVSGEMLNSDGLIKDVLTVDLVLGIPRGEDILVADGKGVDYEMEPQRVTRADGTEVWRIPGASLRGVFRGWFTRLAAREGLPVADSVARQMERLSTPGDKKPLRGDDLAWGFKLPQARKDIQKKIVSSESGEVDWDAYEEEIPCPVMQLFGSSFGKGRIHISDAFSDLPVDKANDAQKRAHVAVDRVTGGANEGFFFVNSVLTGARFRTRITLHNPSELEVKWLIGTLRALQVGVLRVGTSKAGGRLALAEKPKAIGRCNELFDQINWMEA